MNPLTLVGIGIATLGLFSAYLVTQLPRRYGIKWLLIPLVIWMALLFAYKVPEVLGYPKDGYPTHEFRLVGFKVGNSGGKEMIEAWVIEDGKSRLYRFAYDPDVAKALGEMAGSGGGMKGKFQGKPGDKAAGGYAIALTVSTSEVPPAPLPPKITGAG